MALLNTKKTALFLAVGATLPTPGQATFLETSTPTLVVPEFATVDINRISGQMNTKDSVVDPCRTKTSFTIEHTMRTNDKGGTALETVPEYGKLLECAGYIETITGTGITGEVEYAMGVDTIPFTSAIAYLDGQKFEMEGSLSTSVDFDFVVGEPAKLSATLQGYMEPLPTAEANPAIALSDEKVIIVSCADVVTYDGTCLPLTNVSIKMNPEVQDLYTLGGTCGLKQDFISDYAMELTADFYVDSATYAREATNIGTGDMKEIVIKLGLDAASAYVDGQSVEFKASLAKTVTYSDTTDKDLLKRTVTFRLMHVTPANPPLVIKMGKLV